MVFKIRTREPFQRLFDRYVLKRGINLTQTIVTFQLDGEPIKLQNQTPAHYDMEDGELMDVICKTMTIPPGGGGGTGTTRMPGTATAAAAPVPNRGKSLQVTVRTQEIHNMTGRPVGAASRDIMYIKEREPFQNLLVKYKEKLNLGMPTARIVMEFDGEALQLNKTPTDYEMEHEDIIDVKFQR
mmetsp:Transcript_28237/g.43306  ORF Transcript_28237/g.43306 Transcript_28237/m.43306 type:complete len:184 (+) Transcript_28237:3481-4032(+)